MELIFMLFAGVMLFMFIQNMRQGSMLFGSVQKIIDLSLKKQEAELKKKQDYSCNHCHANLENPSDISPSGDVKCHQCDQWYNVYQ
jgi:hypothetical protein